MMYVVSIGVIFVSVMVIGKALMNDYARAVEGDYIPTGLVTDDEGGDIKPVVQPDESKNEVISNPYTSDTVKVAKDYYVEDDEEEKQLNSLIYYQNTYMVNTGVLYNADEDFDVVNVLDGSVTSVTKDDILGNVVEVAHSTELITIYHCLGEVKVNVGDQIKQNEIIGKSGKVNVDKGYEHAMLFEVNYKGKIMNPNEFLQMKVSDFSK